MPRVTLLDAAQKARACLRGCCCRVARLCSPTIQLAGLSKTTPALGVPECSCFIDRLGRAGIATLKCHINALLLPLTGAGEAPQCCCQNCHEVRAQPAAPVVIRESSNDHHPTCLLTEVRFSTGAFGSVFPLSPARHQWLALHRAKRHDATVVS